MLGVALVGASLFWVLATGVVVSCYGSLWYAIQILGHSRQMRHWTHWMGEIFAITLAGSAFVPILVGIASLLVLPILALSRTHSPSGNAGILAGGTVAAVAFAPWWLAINSIFSMADQTAWIAVISFLIPSTITLQVAGALTHPASLLRSARKESRYRWTLSQLLVLSTLGSLLAGLAAKFPQVGLAILILACCSFGIQFLSKGLAKRVAVALLRQRIRRRKAIRLAARST